MASPRGRRTCCRPQCWSCSRCSRRKQEEQLQQLTVKGQAWLGVGRSHEAVAAGLRAMLDQLLQQLASNTENTQSCCLETSPVFVASSARPGARSHPAAALTRKVVRRQ